MSASNTPSVLRIVIPLDTWQRLLLAIRETDDPRLNAIADQIVAEARAK